jgi:hypothetical protein
MLSEGAYIDTGVLGAYYCPELLSAAAEDALRRIEAPVISILSEVEFCSLISKKRRLKELNQRQAKEILDLFATHVAEGFYRRMVLTAEHYLKARQLIASMDNKLHVGRTPFVGGDRRDPYIAHSRSGTRGGCEAT